MNVSKSECYSALSKRLRGIVLKNDGRDKDLINILKDKYLIPEAVSSDFIYDRIDETIATSKRNEIVLFALICESDKIVTTKEGYLRKFYTPVEIQKFSYSKYIKEDLDETLVIDCLPVSDDQFVGTIDAKKLMKMRNANLIRYNPATQRPLRKANGSIEHYIIDLSKKALKSIRQRYKEKLFIPNTITLNMAIPINEEDFKAPDYWYDDVKKQLVFKSIDHFDLLDGYHRYYALCKEYDDNIDFNYPMIVQITIFPEWKAKDFVFQEDQKTRMRRVDSATYNNSNPANYIVEALNNNPECIWAGQIARGSNIKNISFADLSQVISYYYFENKQSQINAFEKNRIAHEITTALNHISSLHEELGYKKWNKGELIVFFDIIKYWRDNKEVILDFPKYLKKVDSKEPFLRKDKVNMATIKRVRLMCGLSGKGKEE